MVIIVTQNKDLQFKVILIMNVSELQRFGSETGAKLCLFPGAIQVLQKSSGKNSVRMCQDRSPSSVLVPWGILCS